MSKKTETSIFFWCTQIFIAVLLTQWMSRLVAFEILNQNVLTYADLLESFRNGMIQDVSASSYYTAVLLLISVVTSYVPNRISDYIKLPIWVGLNIYVILVFLVDLVLLYLWGSHINPQALVYLKYPQQLLVSVPFWMLILLSVVLLIVIYLLVKLGKKVFSRFPIFTFHKSPLLTVIFVVFLLFLGIRGGIGKVPITLSNSQKSKNEKVNILSMSILWNANYYVFGAPLYPPIDHLKKGNYCNQSYLNELYGNSHSEIIEELKGVDLPKNIVLISMEGIGAAVMKGIGGQHANLLPKLDSWCNETGILFSNAYATGDRTDKGIVSLYSAWPGQPWEGIMHDPIRASKLPHLGRKLESLNVNTHFFYGGDARFANLDFFMRKGGIQQLYDLNSIQIEATKGNWGYQDADMLMFMQQVLKKTNSPYFSGIMLLSSHEPYDIVSQPTSSDVDAFYKSVTYVDQSIHDFLSSVWSDSVFDDTWFIITSDHGKYLQTVSTQAGQKEFFRIPLMILGKSLSGKSLKINTTVSQTDIYNTVLHILDKPQEDLKYSRSVLQRNHPNRAWFQLFEVGGLIQNGEANWLTTNPELLQRELPLNARDSAILTLETEIITDFFRLN